MNCAKDYYKILQVHYLAEPEIIESSYKRLAKKYHPDLNKNSDAEKIMKDINEAYEILKHVEKRKRYHLAWTKNQDRPKTREVKEEKGFTQDKSNFLKAKAILYKYFHNLLNKDFEQAYALFTEKDKLNVSKEEFIKWQTTVSKIYQLREFDCTPRKMHKSLIHNRVIYKEAIDVHVVVLEYNEIIDSLERDYFIKTIVLEDNKWKVLLGHEGLQPLIAKFESLSELVKAKLVINELTEVHSKIDYLTQLSNIKGFMEMAKREFYRYKRYKNTFSIAICEIASSEAAAIKKAGQIMQRNFRSLDHIGRWQNSTFIILLPETNIKEGLMAVKKIQGLLAQNLINYPQNKISLGIIEFRHRSLEESLKKVLQYKNIAKNLKGNAIVSSEGIM